MRVAAETRVEPVGDNLLCAELRGIRQLQRLADALAIQLCSVVRSEARFTGPPRPSLRGIPPNAIAVTALTPAYAKKFRGTCLPDLVRGLRLSKLSVLLRDERLSGCVSVAVDEDNNQLMVWPRTRGPCACAATP